MASSSQVREQRSPENVMKHETWRLIS